MDQYVTGEAIRKLRERNRYTQAELASKINVSDKAVSKWETGKGYPDISLLEPLADALNVSVTELLSGISVINTNVSANMLRSRFYVCPVCGNVIYSTGEAVMHCHGVALAPAEGEPPDDQHRLSVEIIEDEYFVRVDHEMAKHHYISFIAALSPDRVQIVKLFPEGDAHARFKLGSVKKIYWYCNRDGLFCSDPKTLL